MRIVTVLALAGALFLPACAGQDKGPSPANIVYAAKQSLVAAQTIAIQYTSLPRCGKPTSPPLCSDESAVAAIRKANADAVLALDRAEAVVRDPNATSSALNLAVSSVTAAVAAFKGIVEIHSGEVK